MNTASEFSPPKKVVLLIAAIAAALFFPLFITGGFEAFDFWWWMAANNIILISLICFFCPHFVSEIRSDLLSGTSRKVALGFASAVFLYLVFYAGNFLSTYLIPGAREGIENVYRLRGEASPLRISLLMLFIFGPGEEIVWRFFFQRALVSWLEAPAGIATASLFYTFVHAGSLNPMLLLAALVCGTFWGLMLHWKKSILANMVSHTAWDLTVFLILPFSRT